MSSPIAILPKGLKIIVVSRPYDTIQNTTTTRILGDIVRFKIASYRDSYPYGILPFDGADLVATHFLLMDGVSEIPLMGFKAITHLECRQFNLPFPIYGLFPPQNLEYRRAIDLLIQEADQTAQPLGYYGSWTMRADVRADANLATLCRDLTTAGVVRLGSQLGFKTAVTMAMTRFKVEKYHRFLGMTPLEHDGKILSGIQSPAMMGDACSVSVLRKFSAEAVEVAYRFQRLWDERTEIANPDERNTIKAA